MKSLLTLTICIVQVHILFAQSDPIDVQVPLSDGEFLAGDLYLPDTVGSFPTILIQTPYGKFFYEINGLPLGIGDDIEDSNYAILIVDMRCRFASISACSSDADDGIDGYDVVEWAAAQAWSNGMIGTWGPSALGTVQWKTANRQPPHLVCCVPEVSAPIASYERYYAGGSLMTERLETFEFLFPGSTALVIAFPYDGLAWDIAQQNTTYVDSVNVPMLLIGGWYDINISQVMELSELLESGSPASANHKTLIGPWVHGGNGQATVGSLQQGELEYPEAEWVNNEWAIDFFDYHLRGINNGWDTRPRYTYFQMGDDSWHQSDTWPPSAAGELSLYLHDDNTLQTSAPQGAFGLQSYEYDPLDPSPTRGGKTLNFDLDQGPFDQSTEVESRDDVLLFTSDPLSEDVVVQGNIDMELFFSSDRLDTDLVVRLTEVYPDGSSMLMSEGCLRMRFREGFTIADTVFMDPGEVYTVSIELEDLALTFQQGNQIRLIVSSSNYPRYNRNMNTGDVMYPGLNIDTLVNPLVATNTLHMSSQFPSNIRLPLGEVPDVLVETDLLSIEIAPNPTAGEVRLSCQKQIELAVLSDEQGRTISTIRPRSNRCEFDLSEQSAGKYLVQVTTADGHRSARTVVKSD